MKKLRINLDMLIEMLLAFMGEQDSNQYSSLTHGHINRLVEVMVQQSPEEEKIENANLCCDATTCAYSDGFEAGLRAGVQLVEMLRSL